MNDLLTASHHPRLLYSSCSIQNNEWITQVAGRFLQDRTSASLPSPLLYTYSPSSIILTQGSGSHLLSHSSLPFQMQFPVPSPLSKSNLSVTSTGKHHQILFTCILLYSPKNSCIQPLSTLKSSCPSLQPNVFAGRFGVSTMPSFTISSVYYQNYKL